MHKTFMIVLFFDDISYLNLYLILMFPYCLFDDLLFGKIRFFSLFMDFHCEHVIFILLIYVSFLSICLLFFPFISCSCTSFFFFVFQIEFFHSKSRLKNRCQVRFFSLFGDCMGPEYLAT